MALMGDTHVFSENGRAPCPASSHRNAGPVALPNETLFTKAAGNALCGADIRRRLSTDRRASSAAAFEDLIGATVFAWALALSLWDARAAFGLPNKARLAEATAYALQRASRWWRLVADLRASSAAFIEEFVRGTLLVRAL